MNETWLKKIYSHIYSVYNSSTEELDLLLDLLFTCCISLDFSLAQNSQWMTCNQGEILINIPPGIGNTREEIFA